MGTFKEEAGTGMEGRALGLEKEVNSRGHSKELGLCPGVPGSHRGHLSKKGFIHFILEISLRVLCLDLRGAGPMAWWKSQKSRCETRLTNIFGELGTVSQALRGRSLKLQAGTRGGGSWRRHLGRLWVSGSTAL